MVLHCWDNVPKPSPSSGCCHDPKHSWLMSFPGATATQVSWSYEVARLRRHEGLISKASTATLHTPKHATYPAHVQQFAGEAHLELRAHRQDFQIPCLHHWELDVGGFVILACPRPYRLQTSGASVNNSAGAYSIRAGFRDVLHFTYICIL